MRSSSDDGRPLDRGQLEKLHMTALGAGFRVPGGRHHLCPVFEETCIICLRNSVWVRGGIRVRVGDKVTGMVIINVLLVGS